MQTQAKMQCLGFMLALLLMLAATGCNKAERTNTYLPSGSAVLVLGDSISDGYALGKEKSWVAHLANATGWQIVNEGVSGDTTTGGLARLPALLQANPQVQAVIIELGGNDILRRTPTQTTIANLSAMIELVQSHQMQAILMASPELSLLGHATGNLNTAPFYFELAEKYRVALIAEALTEVLSDSQNRLDPVHPNEMGHQILAEKALAELKQQRIY